MAFTSRNSGVTIKEELLLRSWDKTKTCRIVITEQEKTIVYSGRFI